MNLFSVGSRDRDVTHVYAQRLYKTALVLLTSLGLGHVAMATPTEGYPPPGGVTYSSTGSSGGVGGKNASYSNLDPAAYSDIYWGLASTTSAQAGLSGALNTLTFTDVIGSTAYFNGTTSYQNAYDGNDLVITVPIQLTLTLTGGTWVTAASLGLSSALGDLADITGTSFSVNEAFTANFSAIADSGASNYQALNNVEQLPGNTGHTETSFGGGFYTDPPVASGVPDTAGTFTLMAISLVGLLGLRRRLSVA